MNLEATIQQHRQYFRDELRRPFQLTVSQVPDETEPIQIGDALVEVTDSGPLGGPSFSRPMNRHLGPPTGYGAQRPWSAGLHALRYWCRKDHLGHTDRRTFGGSLCWQAASYAVVNGYEVSTVARLLSDPDEFIVTYEDTVRHLTRALRWIEEHMDRGMQIRNARDPLPSEETTPSRLSLLMCDAANRQVRDFDTEQRIWEAIRNKHPEMELDEWSVEWSRRQAALLDHQVECDRCRRAA